jgi:hypothetical protein
MARRAAPNLTTSLQLCQVPDPERMLRLFASM